MCVSPQNTLVFFLSSPLSIKCGSAIAGRIYKQYHYNLRGLLLCKSAPIEIIQAGAALSEAQSRIHTSGHCCHSNIPISGETLWSDLHLF